MENDKNDEDAIRNISEREYVIHIIYQRRGENGKKKTVIARERIIGLLDYI